MASYTGVLGGIPAALISIQLPANSPKAAAEDCLRAWALVAQVREPDGVQIQVSVWSSPGCYSHLGSIPASEAFPTPPTVVKVNYSFLNRKMKSLPAKSPHVLSIERPSLRYLGRLIITAPPRHPTGSSSPRGAGCFEVLLSAFEPSFQCVPGKNVFGSCKLHQPV